MTSTKARNAGWVGRILRGVTGLGALALVYFSVRDASTLNWLIPSALWLLGIFGFYLGAHGLIRRYARNLNRWIGALIAVAPAGTLMFSGIGVAAIAALTYVGISLLVDAANGDGGCEVMAFPGILAGERTHLPCIVFSPVDWAESRLTRSVAPELEHP